MQVAFFQQNIRFIRQNPFEWAAILLIAMFISNTLSQGTVEKNGEIVEIFLKMQKKYK